MWILNVGDIKPAEYQIELFMDMGWDINAIENNERGLEKHLFDWLEREFGTSMAKELIPLLNEYYRLAYIRKPEFMGNKPSLYANRYCSTMATMNTGTDTPRRDTPIKR